MPSSPLAIFFFEKKGLWSIEFDNPIINHFDHIKFAVRQSLYEANNVSRFQEENKLQGSTSSVESSNQENDWFECTFYEFFLKVAAEFRSEIAWLLYCQLKGSQIHIYHSFVSNELER